MGSEQDWKRVGQFVADRRAELGLTQEDVRTAGGPSSATMTLIETAGRDVYRPRILAALERALEWRQGSIRAILEGGEPTSLRPSVTEPVREDGESEDDPVAAARRLEDYVREYVRRVEERELRRRREVS